MSKETLRAVSGSSRDLAGTAIARGIGSLVVLLEISI